MIELHPSGALWLPALSTLLIADLHLGFAWAQRRRGELWPLTDAGAALRLAALCDLLQPQTLVLVGDVVHAPNPSPDEDAVIQQTLDPLRSRSHLICLDGNHDHGLGFPSEWRAPGFRAIHGHRLPTAPEPGVLTVIGHFHPILILPDAARIKRRHRAFLHGNGLLVLPAFSPFASGTDMRRAMPPELQLYFGRSPVDVTLTSGEKLLPLGPYQIGQNGFRPLRP
jgi:metallophosphoesterase superfamily enzyme